MVVALPRPSWAAFETAFRKRWQQGEHILISAQTGAGKTELLLRLAPMRSYSTIFVSKPRDPILRTPEARGFKRVANFAPQSHDNRLMLVPPNGKTPGETIDNQREVFREAIDTAYHQGGWALAFDELAYMSEELRLDPAIKRIHHLGRALGITAIDVTQRPFRIPVIVRTSATFGFLGPTARDEDLKALGQIGFDTRATRQAIESLEGAHDFVFVDQRRRLPMMIVNTRRNA